MFRDLHHVKYVNHILNLTRNKLSSHECLWWNNRTINKLEDVQTFCVLCGCAVILK